MLSIGYGPLLAETEVKESPDDGNEAYIEKQEKSEGESEVWAIESSSRASAIYPTNFGHAGTFRIRSAESLPEGAFTFGIGGEFYAITDGPELNVGNTTAKTLAESLFVGFSPTKRLTLGIMRRSSSTTFGNPQQLISSLGDFNFSALYSFPLSKSFALAPIANVLVASNFNNLAPAGNTFSVGFGGAASYSLPVLPMFIHANLVYSMPQIREDGAPTTVQAESYFNFSRFHTVTFGLGSEIRLGDFIPFMEYEQRVQASSGISFFNNPSKITLGTRFMPFDNKSLCFLLGGDIGLGRGLSAGVPFSPGYQIIGQVSYTVGLSNTERKHYRTTKDVNVVDRKFVIKKTIKFKVASRELEESSKDMLDQIADIIKENNINKLLIVGHTDSSHTEDYNLKLSKARAGTVKEYLMGKGVNGDILIPQGYGKRKPIASNLTEEGRQTNRRVEFFILE